MHDDKREFDPRAWNLFAGAALLAGCSTRTLSGEGETSDTTSTDDGNQVDSSTDTTDTTDTTATTDTTDTTTGDGDGDPYYGCASHCMTNAQCYGCGLYGPFICQNGNCVPDYECVGWDYWCSQFEICVGFDCVSQGEPPPSCGFDEFDIPTIHQPASTPLALSFVDVDEDGNDELVVATETELLVYEFGSDVPTASPRMPPSVGPIEMVAGRFDAQPGEDVTLLVAGETHRYLSDSVASLGMPSIEVSPLANPVGLFAGEFDDIAPSDLLVWGQEGALIDLGGDTVPLTTEFVRSGAGFDYGTPAASVAIIRDSRARVYDLSGEEQFYSSKWSGLVGSMQAGDQPGYFTVAENQSDYYSSSWLEIAVMNAPNLELVSTILVPGATEYPNNEGGHVAGDFDGDQYDEILASQGTPYLQIVFGVFTEPCIATQDLGGGQAVAYDIAVGDHDGDGDDEVALIQGADVLVVDVE